jgi:hypothetical protein
MLSKEDQTSLIWLQWHWDRHYVIRVMDGVWSAIPEGQTALVLMADSATELRDKMRDDWAERMSKRRGG